MIKYRTSGWEHDIERVEVERETEHSVWIKGRRRSRWTSYEKYHDTWHNAHAYLKSKAEQTLETNERYLEEYRKELAEIKAMVDPEDTP